MSVLVSASELVTCIALEGKERKAPAEIVFIPEGSNEIFPLSHPKGIMVNVPLEKGESIAASLQAALATRLADDVKPWFDIEHTRKAPASGYPTSFRYEAGKGIMAALDWSGTGKRSVEDRDICHFSPEFTIDEDGIPDGLPTKGPLGGLVAEPAFRKGMRIAASDAAQINNQQTESTNTMSKLIFASLNISAAAENAETEAISKIEKLKAEKKAADEALTAAMKERDRYMEKAEAAEAAEKKALSERADTLVKAAVSDGRILPKDEETQNKFHEKITAGDSFAEEILSKLPKQNDGLGSPIITAGGSAPHDNETRITAAQTKARAELGDSVGFQTIWARAAEIDPKAFEA